MNNFHKTPKLLIYSKTRQNIICKPSYLHVFKSTLITTLSKANNPQNNILFVKRKFGIFKSIAVDNKIIKNQLIAASNFIKYKYSIKSRRFFTPKLKIIFYKRINKLFFRAGRRLLSPFLSIKKNYTQKFLTTRITSIIKNDWTVMLKENRVQKLLLLSNIFYTHKEAAIFISNTGILINRRVIYDPNYNLITWDRFSLYWDKNILIFFLKKRRKIIFNLSNIKFYKFRSKFFHSSKKNFWIPSSEWIGEHSFLYLTRHSNLEFDIRSLTGLFLYKKKTQEFYKSIYNSNLSLFMSRSYNWKYIT